MTLWEWLGLNAASVSALAAGLTATVAVLALLSTARDSRARTDPIVTAEFRIPPDSDSTIDLVIRNLGPTPARDVTLNFEPPLSVPDGGGPFLATYIVNRYKGTIPVLSPGQELTNIWWAGRVDGNQMVNAEPTPESVVITIGYRGVGWRRRSARYGLQVETVSSTTFAVSSTSLKGRLKTIDASLKKIASALDRIARDESR